MRIVIALIALLVGLMAYVRLAPTDTARWHTRPSATEPYDQQDPGGFTAVRRMTGTPEEVLKAVRTRALATPRTRLIAGSVEEGLMTFQSRSLIFGFPDYTTVGISDDLVIIYGRLRFGQADMGVNRQRVLLWLDAVAGLTEPL